MACSYRCDIVKVDLRYNLLVLLILSNSFYLLNMFYASNLYLHGPLILTGDMFTEEQNEMVESAAEMLYGLIHVRYILTSKGMAAMV